MAPTTAECRWNAIDDRLRSKGKGRMTKIDKATDTLKDATDKAAQATKDAVKKTGQAVQNAGAAMKKQGR
jgi:hypothetical protein